jgi:hypothetical protein
MEFLLHAKESAFDHDEPQFWQLQFEIAPH